MRSSLSWWCPGFNEGARNSTCGYQTVPRIVPSPVLCAGGVGNRNDATSQCIERLYGGSSGTQQREKDIRSCGGLSPNGSRCGISSNVVVAPTMNCEALSTENTTSRFEGILGRPIKSRFNPCGITSPEATSG